MVEVSSNFKYSNKFCDTKIAQYMLYCIYYELTLYYQQDQNKIMNNICCNCSTEFSNIKAYTMCSIGKMHAWPN